MHEERRLVADGARAGIEEHRLGIRGGALGATGLEGEQSCVHRRQSLSAPGLDRAGVDGDVGEVARKIVERYADQRAQTRCVEASLAAIPVGAELRHPCRIREECGAAGLVIEIERHQGARGRHLLHDRIGDAVGPDREGRRQGLQVHIALQQARVDQSGHIEQGTTAALIGGEFHRGEGRHPERLAVQPGAGEQAAAQGFQRTVGHGRELPDPIGLAQYRGQCLQFGEVSRLGRNAAIAVRVVGEVMKRQPVGGESHVALIHGILEKRLHPREFRRAWLAAYRVLEPHHLHAQHRVRDQRHHVRAERDAVEVFQVVGRVVPGHAVGATRQYMLGNVFHAREAIDDRILRGAALRAEGRAQRAVAHHHGGGAVAYHFSQARRDLDFEIEVRVDVDQAGHQPLPAALAHLARLFPREVPAAGGDTAARDGNV